MEGGKVGSAQIGNRFAAFKNVSNQVPNGEENITEQITFNSVKSIFESPKIWTRKKRQRKEPNFLEIKIVSDDMYEKILPKAALEHFKKGPSMPKESFVPEDGGHNVTRGGAVVDANKTIIGESAQVKHLAHGMKTLLEVEVVSPNHLRFVDEPEPPDLRGSGISS
ncbi:AcrB/AcrD/AcrF family protein [Sesbania bispinosa]|nr:AcrB/AcrD/AcrF family protein [Sesbania bispinosa]